MSNKVWGRVWGALARSGQVRSALPGLLSPRANSATRESECARRGVEVVVPRPEAQDKSGAASGRGGWGGLGGFAQPLLQPRSPSWGAEALEGGAAWGRA